MSAGWRTVTLSLAVSVLAADAAAAETWTLPREVPGVGRAIYTALEFAPSGRGQALFDPASSVEGATGAAFTREHFRPAYAFAPRGVRFPDPLSSLTVFGRDGVLAAGSLGAFGRPSVRVAIGRIGKPIRRVRPIRIPARPNQFADDVLSTVAVAGNRRGDAAVLATVCACGPTSLYVVRRRAGGRFGRPFRVTPIGTDKGDFGFWVRPVIAMNARGDVLVAWAELRSQGLGVVRARVLRAEGRPGRTQTIGPMFQSGTLTARIGRGGRAIVAWGTMRADTGGAGIGPLEPVTYRYAAAGPRGRFGRPRVIEVGIERSIIVGFHDIVPRSPAIEAEIDRAGRAVIAWTGASVDHEVVRVARVDGSMMHPPQTLGPGTLGQLAVGPRREAMVLWFSPTGEPLASGARGGTAFGAPEPLAPGTMSSPFGSALAFNPRTHRAVAIWGSATTSYAVRAPLG